MPLDDRLRRRIEAIARFLCKPRKALSRMPLRIALCNVILCATTASAANYKVHQWQAVEIELISSVTYADSFQDVDVTATFTTPDGRTITRPVFWDGGLTWKVRFAPPQTGLWTMTTSATDARNSGLNHVTRTVRCDPYSGNLAIYKHGFLKVSKNGRYLTYADGTPFFYLGDTHWILSHERFDTSNAPVWLRSLNIRSTSASNRDLRFSNRRLAGRRAVRKSGSRTKQMPMKKLTRTSNTALLAPTWPVSRISIASSSTLRTTAWSMPMPRFAG